MPRYDFKCNNCEHEYEVWCRIAEREEHLNGSCPNCSVAGKIQQFLTGAPSIGDPIRMGKQKVPQSFKENVLDRVAKVPGAVKTESKFNM